MTDATNLYTRPILDSTTYKKPYEFQLRDRVIMKRYTGELGTVVGFDSLGNMKVQLDSSAVGQIVRFPPEYFELYFRKESQEPEPVRDYESKIFVLEEKIKRLNDYIAKLEEDGFKYRRTLVEIQMKAQDILRPIPFQEDYE
jgi:hypothetical protein